MTHERVQKALAIADGGPNSQEGDIRRACLRISAGAGGADQASTTIKVMDEHWNVIHTLAKEVRRLTDVVIKQQVD